MEKMITVKELDAYLQDKVPEITQKYKAQRNAGKAIIMETIFRSLSCI